MSTETEGKIPSLFEALEENTAPVTHITNQEFDAALKTAMEYMGTIRFSHRGGLRTDTHAGLLVVVHQMKGLVLDKLLNREQRESMSSMLSQVFDGLAAMMKQPPTTEKFVAAINVQSERNPSE